MRAMHLGTTGGGGSAQTWSEYFGSCSSCFWHAVDSCVSCLRSVVECLKEPEELSRYVASWLNTAGRTVEGVGMALYLAQQSDLYQNIVGALSGWSLFLRGLVTPLAITVNVLASYDYKGNLKKSLQMLRNVQFWASIPAAIAGGVSVSLSLILQYIFRTPYRQVKLLRDFFWRFGFSLPFYMLTLTIEQCLLGLSKWHFVPTVIIQVISLSLLGGSPWIFGASSETSNLGWGSLAQYFLNWLLLEVYMLIMFGRDALQFSWCKKIWKRIYEICRPIYAQIMIEFFTVLGGTWLADLFSRIVGVGQAVYSGGMQFISLWIPLILGLARAGCLLFARSLRGSLYRQARNWAKGTLIFGVIVMSLLTVGIILARNIVVRPFLPPNPSPETTTRTGWFTVLVTFMSIFDLIRNVSTNLLVPLNNAWFIALTTFFSLGIGFLSSVGLGYLGARINESFFNADTGIQFGQLIGFLLCMVVIVAALWHQTRNDSNLEYASKSARGYRFGFWRRTRAITAGGPIRAITVNAHDDAPDAHDSEDADGVDAPLLGDGRPFRDQPISVNPHMSFSQKCSVTWDNLKCDGNTLTNIFRTFCPCSC